MKKATRILNGLLAAWLCLVMVLDFKSVADMVLCFGEDGHVEWENSVDDKCGTVTEDHCGDCLDVNLSGVVSETLKNRSTDVSIGDLFPIVLSTTIQFSIPRVITSLSQIHGPSRELNSYRTVRLLV